MRCSWQLEKGSRDIRWCLAYQRTHLSKNSSFIIKNYLTGGLLWCSHKCMKGNDDVIDEGLYEGTAKSMEEVLADQCYVQGKVEGCKVNTVWQDGDSTSANAVSLHYHHHPTAKVYVCGGHVGRAHTNNLKEAAKKKEFSADIKNKYNDKFPSIETVKCKCSRHKSGCGCLSDSFIKGPAAITSLAFFSKAKLQKHMSATSEICQPTIAGMFLSGIAGHVMFTTCSCKKCGEDDDLSTKM